MPRIFILAVCPELLDMLNLERGIEIKGFMKVFSIYLMEIRIWQYRSVNVVYLRVKRFLDILLSLIGLILLAPLLLVLTIAIKADSKGPVLFRQKRVGRGKIYFYILKFRTMRIDTPKDTPTHLLANPEQYITRIGKFMRRTSLDELPQIWNIFVGQMSIIGPRPALWNQYDLIRERDKYGANDILPGLTGWAQINGRDELPIELKAKLDGDYVQRMGLSMDVRCFFLTIISVFKRDGIVEGGAGTLVQKKVAVTKEPGSKYLEQ